MREHCEKRSTDEKETVNAHKKTKYKKHKNKVKRYKWLKKVFEILAVYLGNEKVMELLIN